MRSFMNRCVNLNIPYVLLSPTDCAYCKVRECSKKINSPPITPEHKEESKKYLYKIPPWMRKVESEKIQDKDIVTNEKKKEFLGSKPLKNRNEIVNKHEIITKLKKENNCRHNSEMFLSTKMDDVKGRIKEGTATTVLMRKEKKLDSDPANKSANIPFEDTSKLLETSRKSAGITNSNKFSAACTAEKSQPILNKENQSLITTKQKKQELSTSQHKRSQEQTTAVTNNPQNINNIIKRLEMKPQDINEIIKQLPKIDVINDKEVKTSQKQFSKKPHTNSSMGMKVNNFPHRDEFCNGAKEKVTNIKKKEIEPTIYKSGLDTVVKNNLAKIEPEAQLESKNVAQSKGQSKNIINETSTASKTSSHHSISSKNEEKKQQVILNLVSTPLKLNSKEGLYVNQSNIKVLKKESKQEIAKKEFALKMKKQFEKNVLNVRKRLQSKKRKPNKLQNIDADKSIINMHKKRDKNFLESNLTRGNNINLNFVGKNQNKYLTQLFSQKNMQNNIRRELIVNQLSQIKELNSTKNNNFRKSILNTEPTDSFQRANYFVNSNNSNTQYSHLGMSQAWFKDIKIIPPKIHKTPLKSIRKPIFTSNKPTLKMNPINKKHHLKTKFNVNWKNKKPIFGPPTGNDGQDSNDDDNNCPPTRPVCVVNSDTCLSDTQANESISPSASHSEISKTCPQEKSDMILLPTNKYTLPNFNFKAFINICKYLYNRIKTTQSCEINEEAKIQLNRPSDNINVSVLVTDSKKQPIYIPDPCSYLKKYPTVYQRLRNKLKNFSHLIKTKEIPQKEEIHTITDDTSQQIDSNDCAKMIDTNSTDQNECMINNKKKNFRCKPASPRSFPKKSYSEILSKLFSTHLQQRS